MKEAYELQLASVANRMALAESMSPQSAIAGDFRSLRVLLISRAQPAKRINCKRKKTSLKNGLPSKSCSRTIAWEPHRNAATLSRNVATQLTACATPLH